MRAAIAVRSTSGLSGGDGIDHQEKAEQLQLQLLSVQRNYESMSRLMAGKQTEINKLTFTLEAEQSHSSTLVARLETALQRATVSEAAVARLSGLPAQLEQLQAEHDTTKFELSLANGKLDGATERIGKMHMQLGAAEQETLKWQQKLEAYKLSGSSSKGQIDALNAKLKASAGEERALLSELRATKDDVTRAKAQATAAEQRAVGLASRCNEYEETVSSLRDSIRLLQQQLSDASSSTRTLEVTVTTAKSQEHVLQCQLRSGERTLELTKQLQVGLHERIQGLEESLAAEKIACLAAMDEAKRTYSLLIDTQDALQRATGDRFEADEAMAGMQGQVVQARAAAAEAHHQMKEQEKAHAAAMKAAQAAAAAAHAQFETMTARQRKAQHRSQEFGQLTMQRVENLTDRLAAAAGRMDRALAEEQMRHDKAITVLQCKLEYWEGKALELAAATDNISSGLDALSHMAIARAAAAARNASATRGSTAALEARVVELEAALAAEQQRRSQTQQAKDRSDAQHTAALAAAQTQADERVASERRALTQKLSHVEAEVARLRKAYEGDKVATAQLLEMEKGAYARQVAVLEAEMVKLRTSLAEKSNVQRSIQEQRELATLSLLHSQQMEKAAAEHAAQVQLVQQAADKASASSSACWQVAHQLLTDMATVAAHLRKMGVDVKDCVADVSKSPDDGPITLLSKGCNLLRLNFSYITEAVQHMIRNPPSTPKATPPDRPGTDWAGLTKELKGTVAKMVHVEDSLATNCTCMVCLEIFTNPVLCVPCGHSYCRACLEGDNMMCRECGDRKIDIVMNNNPLDAICSKYEVKRSVLGSIQRAVQAL